MAKTIDTALEQLKDTVELLSRVALYRELSALEQTAKDNSRKQPYGVVSLEEDMARS